VGQEYIKAKAAEYAIVLSWIDQELQKIDVEHPDHHQLIIRLQSRLAEAQELHNQLKTLARIGNVRLLRRAFPIIHELEFITFLIASNYLPALEKEGKADQFLRQLLLATMKRCGLNWIEDIAVQLNGEHAIISSSSLVAIPLIFAPPQHAASFSDMPGLYHELGHNVFERFHEIADVLAMTVSQHFARFRKKAGPITPEQRYERDQAINDALDYWERGRLNELFCDIFATFVCGPAHYVSCVDMGLRDDRDPFQVDEADVHPPLSARISACYRSLTPEQRKENVVIAVNNTWKGHERLRTGNGTFDLVCSNALVDRLVETSCQCIEQALPTLKRYSKPLSQDENAEEVLQESSLEDILNRGMNLLFTHPERYADWEMDMFKLLRSIHSLHVRI